MNTIKLDRQEIIEKIKAGDNSEGHHVLAVAPDGSEGAIHWDCTNAQWNPWPDGWLAISIPALFAEGESDENDLAEECLKNYKRLDEAKALVGADDISLVDAAERLLPIELQAYKDEQADWLADAFLATCNGDGTDLNRGDAPWGHTAEMDGYEAIDPPAEFEWA
jgi:hypothetical protein